MQQTAARSDTLRVVQAVGVPGWMARHSESRRLGAALLIAAWGLAAVAQLVGDPGHGLALKVGTAFLLWRIWRGADWSRWVLIALSILSAGLALGLLAGVVLGDPGIVLHKVAMLGIYGLVGVALSARAVRHLSRFG